MTGIDPEDLRPGGAVPSDPAAGPEAPPKDKDAWKLVYFGQISRDLVPYHPEPPETPEDELTRAALEDPDSVTRGEPQPAGPTLWRVLAVFALAVTALALVFWNRRW
jgi:hypothetical protein